MRKVTRGCGDQVHQRGRKDLALQREDHREVPLQHVDLKIGAVRHQPFQEIAEPVRHGRVGRVLLQLHAGIEIPAEQDDRVLRLQHRRLHGGVIGGRIDDQGHAVACSSRQQVLPGISSGVAGSVSWKRFWVGQLGLDCGGMGVWLEVGGAARRPSLH